MPLTTSLFVSLLLLLPGLTGLAVWNFRGSREMARRPELPLAAVNSLFVTIAAALAVHVAGAAVVHLLVGAGEAWRASDFPPTLPPLHNPYPVALRLLVGQIPEEGAGDIYGLLCLVGLECLVVARVLTSPGVALALRGQDLRGVGWVHTHYLEPLRNDYSPIAFVMLQATDDGRGVGYSGPIADLRLSADGEVRSISLGQPERFVYELSPGAQPPSAGKFIRTSAGEPGFTIYDAKWVGSLIHLAADRIDNIVVLISPNEELEAEARRPSTPLPAASV